MAAPAGVQSGATGLSIDGLSEAIGAFRKFDKEYANQIRRDMRKETNTLRDESRKRMQRRPGGGTYRRQKAQIGSKSNQRYAEISLRRSRYPQAVAAELGTYMTGIPIRERGDKYSNRRISNTRFTESGRPGWGPYRGFPTDLSKGRSGSAVIPAIRTGLPAWEKNLARGMNEVMQKLLASQGVPTATRGE